MSLCSMMLQPQVPLMEEGLLLEEVRLASRTMLWTSLKVPKRQLHPKKQGMTCWLISAKRCRIWRKTLRLVLLGFRQSLRTPCSLTRLKLSLWSSTSTRRDKSSLSLTLICQKILMSTLTATYLTTSFKQIFFQQDQRYRKLTKLTTTLSSETTPRMMRMIMLRAISPMTWCLKILSKRTWWRWKTLARPNWSRELLNIGSWRRPQEIDQNLRGGRLAPTPKM